MFYQLLMSPHQNTGQNHKINLPKGSLCKSGKLQIHKNAKINKNYLHEETKRLNYQSIRNVLTSSLYLRVQRLKYKEKL